MISGLDLRASRRIAVALLLGAGVCASGAAQVPDQTVQWSAAVSSKSAVKHGAAATLVLSAEVLDGWHVYALTQPPGGPTALRVALDENAVARAAGRPSGTAPERKYDPSFDLETQFYARSFTLYLPVRLKEHAAVGWQSIPVSVRFQTCNGRECQPPKTVHLSASVEVAVGA